MIFWPHIKQERNPVLCAAILIMLRNLKHFLGLGHVTFFIHTLNVSRAFFGQVILFKAGSLGRRLFPCIHGCRGPARSVQA